MDCRAFLDRLEALLAEELSEEESCSAQMHLRQCADCRELERLARVESDDPAITPPADLADAVLELTTGSSCRPAEGLLCDHVERRLDDVSSELVRLHVESCPDCAALVRTLIRMTEDLPVLAELEPDPRFVSDVLSATRDRVARRPASGLVEACRLLLQRPRIAWEGAYVATVLLALAFGSPGSPLAGVHQKALQVARNNPVQELKGPAVELENRVAEGVRSAWQASGEKVVHAYRQTASDVYERITTGLGTLVRGLASEEEENEGDVPNEEKGSVEGDEA